MRTESLTASLPSRVYLDTQFVFSYLVPETEDHRDAEALARRIETLAHERAMKVFVSVVVLDELAWRLASALYDRDAKASQRWRDIGDGEKGKQYDQRRLEIAKWLLGLLNQPWLSLLPADQAVCRRLPTIIERYHLRPADAAHLACAVRHDVLAIVTNDHHFLSLPDAPVQMMSYAGQADLPGPQ